jgi:hypothetical protein
VHAVIVKIVKKFPVALLGSGAPLNCLMKYAGSLDPAARCGKPYIRVSCYYYVHDETSALDIYRPMGVLFRF